VGPIEVTVVEWLGNGRSLERILASRAHKSAVLLALKARAVEESFPDLCVMAIADRGHHVTAVVAKMLDRFLPATYRWYAIKTRGRGPGRR